MLFRACYLEIYNEKVIDLLEAKTNKSQIKKIEIQKDGLHITPLKAVVCQNAQMVKLKTICCLWFFMLYVGRSESNASIAI